MSEKNDGRFKPGKSGNPGGRPKGVAEVIELARQHGPAAIEKLVKLMNAEDTPAQARIAAINTILDRGYGKPPQAVTVAGDDEAAPIRFSDVTDEMRVAAVAALRAKLLSG